MGHQGFAVGAALLGRTQAVQLQAHMLAVLQTKLAQQAAAQQDDLGVHIRAVEAQGLHTHLMELAVAALLRLLAAEHGTEVVETAARVAQKAVLDHGAHHARGHLGAQGQMLGLAVLVGTVLEGVHLLLDDIGHLADAAHEQGRGLDDGRAHILVAVALQHAAHLAFQPFPARRLRRQDVVHALHSLQGLHLLLLSHGYQAVAPKRFSM